SPRELLPELPRDWEAVILRCLERKPEQRFASSEEVAKALRGERVASPKRSLLNSPAMRAIAAISLIGVLVAAGDVVLRATRSASAVAVPAATNSAARTSVAVLGFQNLSKSVAAQTTAEILAENLWSQLDTDELRFISPAQVDEMKKNLGL